MNNKKEKDGLAVLIVEPLKEPYMKVIPDSLKSLQNEVAGHIEAIFPFEDPVAIVLNSEGKFNNLMPNRGLYDCDGQLCDFIAGTFFITGLSEEGFVSLSEELTAKYMEKYKVPEKVGYVNGVLTVMPILDHQRRDSEKRVENDAANMKPCNKRFKKRNRSDEER